MSYLVAVPDLEPRTDQSPGRPDAHAADHTAERDAINGIAQEVIDARGAEADLPARLATFATIVSVTGVAHADYALIGDGAAQTFDVDTGTGKAFLTVQVYRTDTGAEEPVVKRMLGAGVVRVTTLDVPATDALAVTWAG